ncbi:YbaL family putative K(+) efflux transporter [Pseudorhodoplanes sinuspersici]|uniref:Kef family K(+) transporter n=1 Tax=Pseudorhodoplanes sinuspersici TaxID=1235591 RepID=A0A1W6ZN75_9HYPH|nr:YbaL family putative K(+) efflux transporter [Pseudorhodoplanes sinuspersici]ARP98853.1 Kef family K(+) transporter [Pseudorhodoplanes sinuspersici]RKE69528.1 Kef-type potassium/proton antiporter (CPA2 family) [Pseudorhodoplanes sinuspersici]
MHHDAPLISTIVIGLVLAFGLGVIAQRLRVSPLLGYLVAGILMGPFTPGYVADQNIANQLAEIGVILLMFGVGLHFSLNDLLKVKGIAIPGAIAQIAAATLLGMGLAHLLGWSIGAGVVFGLALSVASTVVLLRALQERRLIETDRGRIAVGWLIVEDIAMVLALVMLPVMADAIKSGNADLYNYETYLWPLGITLAKVAGFVLVMLVLGKRIIPWILHYVAHTGSRELFRLAVLSIALGFAFGAATVFDVSFALGAFFAGMILAESELSQRAAQETLPLRDAFAVLFFVSVGMLFDPAILWRDPLPVLATLLIILVGKSVAAYVIVRLFRYPAPTALTISASLAQIGEFSFILIGLGVSLALLPERGRDLVLAGAILSILLNPIFFALLDRYLAKDSSAAEPDQAEDKTRAAREPIPVTTLIDHVVLIGYGRVGGFVGRALLDAKTPLLVIDTDSDVLAPLKQRGIETITGNVTDKDVLAAANLGAARCLLVAVPDAFEGGYAVELGRKANPSLKIIARSHSEEETAHLLKHGATEVVMGEHEIAKAMIAGLPPLATPADAPAAHQPADVPVVASAEQPAKRVDVSPAESAGPTGWMP